MGKLALVATVNTVAANGTNYVRHLKAHAQRCLATEPSTLEFELSTPKDEADTVIYEVFSGPEALQAHRHGPSKKRAAQDAAGLTISGGSKLCDIIA